MPFKRFAATVNRIRNGMEREAIYKRSHICRRTLREKALIHKLWKI